MTTAPTLRSVGTLGTSTAAPTVGLPTGWQPYDLLILALESENQDIATPSTPAGWTQIGSAQGSGVAATDTSVRLELFWKIAQRGEVAPTIADSGDHTSGLIMAIIGADLNNPINAQAGTTAASSTSVSFPGVTTTVDNCYVIDFIAGSEDTAVAQASAWTNAGLSGYAEITDQYAGTAGGGGISAGAGTKTTAGATGSSTATMAAATLQALHTVAIAPAPDPTTGVPRWIANGTPFNSTGSPSAGIPAGYREDDILILFAESENQDISTPAGWTQIGSAQGSGVAGTDTSIRLEAWYKVATSSESSVTVADPGDHVSGFIAAFRGVDITTPINVQAGNTAASSTAVSIPTITTTVDKCLVVAVVSGSQDTTVSQASGFTNANLNLLTERADYYTTQGGGGGISMACGEMLTAGATGATTATLANASIQGLLQFALTPLTDYRIIAGAGSYGVTGTAATLVYTSPLIEDFEGSPLTSRRTWSKTYQDASVGVSTITRTTSNVTQGTYSWRVEGDTTSFNYPGFTNTVPLDLTPYDTITLEVYVQTLNAESAVTMHLVDTGGSPIFDALTAVVTTTGAHTLTFNVADIAASGVDPAACYMEIYAGLFTVGGGLVDFYVDELRGNVSGGGSFTLTADAGSYVLNGDTASLERGLEVAGDAGSYAITGTAAGFEFDRAVAALAGSYLISGDPSNLERNTLISIAAGSYDITGMTASLFKAYPIIASGGVYDITGGAVGFVRSLEVTADSGSYLLSGTASGLIRLAEIAANAGSYDITGNSVGLLRAVELTADGGLYTLTGSVATLLKALKLAANGGVYSLTGTDVNVIKKFLINAEAGLYNITGADAGLVFDTVGAFTLSAESGTYSLTGTAANVLFDILLSAQSSNYAITGTAAQLAFDTILSALSGSYNISGNDVSLVFTPSEGTAFVYIPTFRRRRR